MVKYIDKAGDLACVALPYGNIVVRQVGVLFGSLVPINYVANFALHVGGVAASVLGKEVDRSWCHEKPSDDLWRGTSKYEYQTEWMSMGLAFLNLVVGASIEPPPAFLKKYLTKFPSPFFKQGTELLPYTTNVKDLGNGNLKVSIGNIEIEGDVYSLWQNLNNRYDSVQNGDGLTKVAENSKLAIYKRVYIAVQASMGMYLDMKYLDNKERWGYRFKPTSTYSGGFRPPSYEIKYMDQVNSGVEK